MEQDKKFRILSIDGGGIRGLIPAKILAELESQLSIADPNKKLYDYFDLICGTSTGAILAIGVALGIPAKDLVKFYKEHAKAIFPKWYFFSRQAKALISPIYSNKQLRRLLKDTYSRTNNGRDPLLNDMKTKVCIPSFNGNTGEINILKTKHHKDYTRDYKLPAYEVALSSASAPVYFPPNSFTYDNELGSGFNINMIDGGIFANNPSLIGLLEATEKLSIEFKNIELVSLGTGRGKQIIKKNWLPKNFWYWFLPKPRLLDITLDSQSQITEQYILFINRVLKKHNNAFHYERVQYEFGDDLIDLNASKPSDMNKLEAIGGELAKKHVYRISNLLNNK
ncbi:CBASS cGAMP-activated phospholipase [Daejeonella lutea]|nr:CBASS cGAMP-activated phospholipase [Daejeonella lutea]